MPAEPHRPPGEWDERAADPASRHAPPGFSMRRLVAADAAIFRDIRLDGFRSAPEAFRVTAEDEAARPLEALAKRLDEQYVVGGFRDGTLQGVGGLARYEGAKLRHKALLWGMYVRASARGTGLAGAIIAALLDRARAEGIDSVLLTVVASNERARRLYERWGFEVYGVEPAAVRDDDGDRDEALMVLRLSRTRRASGGA